MHFRRIGRLLIAGAVVIALAALGAGQAEFRFHPAPADAQDLVIVAGTAQQPVARFGHTDVASIAPSFETVHRDGEPSRASSVLPLPPATSIFPMMMFVVALTMRRYRRGF